LAGSESSDASLRLVVVHSGAAVPCGGKGQTENMARVLVTGPTGASGQYILERLMTTDHDVNVLALPDSIHRMNYRDRIRIVPGHLHDPVALAEALDGVEIVFHAAITGLHKAVSPDRMIEINTSGTAALVAAAGGRIRRFVLVSSFVVLAPHRSPAVWPVRDDALRMPNGNPQQTAFAESLIAAEDIVFDAADRRQFEHCTLRPTHIAGRAGGTIDSIVTGLLRGTTDPEAERRTWGVMHWAHGSDLARAALLVAGHEETGNQCFTVAGDQPVTIHDIQAILWDLLNIGRDGNMFAETAALHNLGLAMFDSARLKALGWVPQMTMRDCLAECLGRLEFHSSASLRMPPHMLDS